MPRYIDADAIKHLIDIKTIPTADVVEVVHGKWIPVKEADVDYNQEYECSECHAHDDHAISQVVPYCWHCGARMDERRDDE